MATRAPRKSLTAEDLKKKLAEAKEAIKALERKAFASEITEAIKKSSIPAEFQKIKEGAKGVSDIAILETIGEIVGIKRLVVTQSEPVKRKPRAK
ncbi:hypothetical protein A9236_02955 [Polynucleobacter sp. QLW-P1DATA-2]|jgi:hypothetical protein|uniref:hypothetical protein n=1 Tax=Polynucleobacter sp. QLW-P1DATA-2 TaxID=1743167 RepID=UPI0008F820AF|nr:hypothetical protein [Polynucleobacter sp. QLW-P1DATA-2]MBT8596158.1 hypothetical protein [Polynucleobacter paneuropaeus]OIN00257.1 hypothetical protein A9236_02955 [Polynucleobacter sp. QLW-P1DATA-2]